MKLIAVTTAALALFAITVPASGQRPSSQPPPPMPSCDPGDICSDPPPPPCCDPPPPCCDPGPVSHEPIDLVFEGGITEDDGDWSFLSTSGCRTVTNYVAGKELLFGLQTLFRHNLRTSWCWSRNAVTAVAATCYISDLTSTEVRVRAPCLIDSWPYMYNNNPKGGRVVEGTGYYKQCFLDDICYRELTVTARTYLHGDGTYTRGQS